MAAFALGHGLDPSAARIAMLVDAASDPNSTVRKLGDLLDAVTLAAIRARVGGSGTQVKSLPGDGMAMPTRLSGSCN